MRLTDGLLPYGNVLINGHVLGPDSLKMSKSRGNVVDPRDGIEQFGADAIRQTILGKKVGTDFPFQWDKAQYGKSFLQKLWSVSRYLSIYFDDIPETRPRYSPIDKWILRELEQVRKEVTAALDRYEIHTGLTLLQEFTWKKVCDNYLESVKPFFRSKSKTRFSTVMKILYEVLWAILRMLAPYIPHITEAIYLQMFQEQIGKLSIHATSWPKKSTRRIAKKEATVGEQLIDLIALIRQEKSKMGIALNQPLAEVIVTIPKEQIDNTKKYRKYVKLPLHVKNLTLKPGEEITITIKEK
jgi:valyl-tRNA synthetase